MTERESHLLAVFLGLSALCVSAMNAYGSLGSWKRLKEESAAFSRRVDAAREGVPIAEASPVSLGSSAFDDFRSAFRSGGTLLDEFALSGEGSGRSCDFSFHGSAVGVVGALSEYDARPGSLRMTSLFLALGDGGLIEGRAGASGPRGGRVRREEAVASRLAEAFLAHKPAVRRIEPSPHASAAAATQLPTMIAQRIPYVGSFELPGGSRTHALKDPASGRILFMEEKVGSRAEDGGGRIWTVTALGENSLRLTIEGTEGKEYEVKIQ